jgi:tetratricopeptide (TPR) repeat protein
MTSKVPFLKSEISKIAVIIQLLFFISLNVLFYFINKTFFDVKALSVYLQSAAVYFSISYSLRRLLVPKAHREGIALIKEENFEAAIPCFQKCVDFFTRHAWIDKYRAMTMFVSSKRTFREISLCNMAFCMLQSQKVNEAKRIYDEVLIEYPENTIARSAINTINSLTSYNQTHQ